MFSPSPRPSVKPLDGCRACRQACVRTLIASPLRRNRLHKKNLEQKIYIKSSTLSQSPLLPCHLQRVWRTLCVCSALAPGHACMYMYVDKACACRHTSEHTARDLPNVIMPATFGTAFCASFFRAVSLAPRQKLATTPIQPPTTMTVSAAIQPSTEELFDILHEDGTPKGISKARSAVHRDGDWHRSTHIWVLSVEGRVLIQKRAVGKDTFPVRLQPLL